MKKRYRSLILASSIAIAVTLSACNAKDASTETEQVEKETPVQIGKITKGNLTVKTEIIAKAVADSTVDVIPKMVGELVQINVKKGDKVKKGDVLAVIDNKNQKITVQMEKTSAQNAQVQYDQAIVAKKQAKTALKNAEIGMHQAELNLQKAKDGQSIGMTTSESNLEQAQRGVNDAQLNYERMRVLFEYGAVSAQQLEQAESTLNQAKNAFEQAELQKSNTEKTTDIELIGQSVELAKIGLSNAKHQLELADASIKQAEVAKDSNELRIEQAELQLDNSKIIATTNGEVTDINGTVGQVVSTGVPFTTIVNLDNMNIEAHISAEQLTSFKVGQEVKVEIPSLHETFTAKISYISNIADQGGFYLLEASIPNKDKKIKSGMIAKVINESAVVEDSLLVPTNAVIEKGTEVYVYVVKDGKAVQTPVEIIRSQTELTAIKGEGLSEATTIVVRGQKTLSDGNKVRIIEGEQ